MRRQWNEIRWSIIKTGQQFQSFCNKLLEFEFGSDFTPYGAKGRDMGIDAQFIGKYNNKEGNFIFNYKFLDPFMDKNKARSLIEQRLKGTKGSRGELQKMDVARPDFYYVLTNVKGWKKNGRVGQCFRNAYEIQQNEGKLMSLAYEIQQV